jgi:hypothetical protein
MKLAILLFKVRSKFFDKYKKFNGRNNSGNIHATVMNLV